MGELNFDEIGDREVGFTGGLDLDLIRPRFEDYKTEAARIATDAKALTVQDQATAFNAFCGALSAFNYLKGGRG